MKRAIQALALATLTILPLAGGAAEAGEAGKPATVAGHQPKGLMEAMGLSEAQREQLKAAREKHEGIAKPLRAKRKDLLEKLEAAVKAKAPDAEIKPLIDELAATQRAIQAENDAFNEARRGILTPTQAAKGILGMKAALLKRAGGRALDAGEALDELGN
jgi:Spy/CpxP family protein refolding chaperone